jgi:hypothetical protein
MSPGKRIVDEAEKPSFIEAEIGKLRDACRLLDIPWTPIDHHNLPFHKVIDRMAEVKMKIEDKRVKIVVRFLQVQ